jgi:glutathione S-transferase
MKLYYAPGACSLAPHIAAAEAGVPVDLVKVDIRAKKLEDGGDYLQVNPKGAVPALGLDEGGVLTENAVVMQYIAERAPGSELVPASGLARWRLLELLNYIGTEVHKGFGPLWNPSTSPEAREAAISNLSKKFDFLEKQLGDGPYLTGQAFTIADAYAFAVLSWTGHLKVPFDRWPKLQAYMGRVAQRPAVQAALRAEGLLQ